MSLRSTCGAQDCEDGRYQHVHLIAHVHAWKMEEKSEYSKWCRCHLKMKPDGTSLKNSPCRQRDVRYVGVSVYIQEHRTRYHKDIQVCVRLREDMYYCLSKIPLFYHPCTRRPVKSVHVVFSPPGPLILMPAPFF